MNYIIFMRLYYLFRPLPVQDTLQFVSLSIRATDDDEQLNES